jgi:hypothetical protein
MIIFTTTYSRIRFSLGAAKHWSAADSQQLRNASSSDLMMQALQKAGLL